MSIDPAICLVDPARRTRILPVLQAALDAVDPVLATARSLHLDGDRLAVADTSYDLAAFERITLLGIGKAAVAMGRAAVAVLGDRLSRGVLLTKYGHSAGADTLPQCVEVVEAGHPTPDQAGVDAAARIAALAQQAGPQDLLLCLISGGGSALLTLPAVGLTLSDLQATTAALLACGASIDEINTLRKHLEQLKGGQLARLSAPAHVLSLVLSDVVGSPLDVIASGPTVADHSTWADAWRIVERYRLEPALPAAVIERLRAGRAGRVPDTVKDDEPALARSHTVIVADNAQAAQAACACAEAQGFHARVLTTFLEGEAQVAAGFAVALGREVMVHGRPAPAPACLILGGETTVTLTDSGRGGRNQELALAAALHLARAPEGPSLVVASLATDGSDGPTDAAGGLVDVDSVARGRAAGLDAAAHLAGHNAYPFLQAAGDLLRTGPTQTNVNDLVFVFAFPVV